MKKTKCLFILFVSLVLLSGCVKNTNTMTINKDKSMLFETDIVISDALDKNKVKDDYIQEFKDLKLKVTSTKEEGYTGYKISKSFKNIDDICSLELNEVKVEDILKKNTKDLKLFKRTKGFIKDTYTANILFELTEETKNKYDISNSEIGNASTVGETTYEDELEEDDMSELTKLAELSAEVDYKYIVNLPYAAVKSNSTETSNNNKTLIWDLSTEPGKTNIDYTFVVYNMTHIYILIGCGVLLLIGIIVLLIIIKHKKKSSDTLIHKDYDPSIAEEIGEPVIEENPEDIIPQPGEDNK